MQVTAKTPASSHTGQPIRFSTRRLSPLWVLLLCALLPFANRAVAQETVRVGIYQNPPKVYRDADGQPSGFFVDILAAIARAEELNLSYIDCEWNNCLQMLEQGELDLMPDVAYSPQREQRFDFHRNVVLANWSLLYAPDAERYQSVRDLDGVRIAVIRDSIQYQALQHKASQAGIHPNYIELDSSEAAMQEVAEGRADAALVNRLYGLQHAGHFGLKATRLVFKASQLYYATTKHRHAELLAAIDQQLAVMKSRRDSPYYRALSRWLEPLEAKGFPKWLPWLLLGLAGMLLALVVHSYLLKHAIRKARWEIEQQSSDIIASEAKYRRLFETSADAIILIQGEEVVDVNPAMLRTYGYPDKTAAKRLTLDDLFPATQPNGDDSHALARHYLQQAYDDGIAAFEWNHLRADGSSFPAEVTLVSTPVNNQPLLQATVRDISKLRKSLNRQQRLNRALKTLSKANHALVHADDEADLLNTLCQILVASGNYRLAWIGYAQDDDRRSVTPKAQYGFEEGYLDSLRISWQDDEYGQGPTGTAIRSGQYAVARNIHSDPKYAPWREQAVRRGYASSIALPIIHAGTTYGALNIYSAEANAFDDEEIILLQELADDLGFGIRNQRMKVENSRVQEERLRHEQQLENALLQTIQSVSAMVEMRDPFTAGHLRRSADLAVALGEELGLDDATTEGLHLGAMIHDIGNIYLPAEILNRSGRLTEQEQDLIHTHVEAGYNIIKEIDFPWPIANMILYHHERLDGSGYPRGCSGDDIPFNARIIAVADVVEAMLSHRPYRQALSLEEVLRELQEGSGNRYDSRVVDACIRLFNERGYKLPN